MSDDQVYRRIADDYVAAFNRRDLDRLATLFDEAVTLRDWSLRAVGREAVLQANRDMFAATRSLTATVLNSVADGRTVFLELDVVVDGQEHLPVVDILEFTAAGRLQAIRAFKG